MLYDRWNNVSFDNFVPKLKQLNSNKIIMQSKETSFGKMLTIIMAFSTMHGLPFSQPPSSNEQIILA